jgi:hypothetical protein
MQSNSYADFPPGLTKPVEPDAPHTSREPQDSNGVATATKWDGDLSRLSGDWQCTGNMQKSMQEGMVQVFGVPPARMYVLVFSALSWNLHLPTTKGEPSTGSITRVVQKRVASPQEKQASAITDIKGGFTLGIAPDQGVDLCMLVGDGQCQAQVSYADTYEVTSAKEISENHVELILGPGRCAGQCGRDPYKSPGKKLAILLKESNPGMYVGWPNQEHYQYCNRIR